VKLPRPGSWRGHKDGGNAHCVADQYQRDERGKRVIVYLCGACTSARDTVGYDDFRERCKDCVRIVTRAYNTRTWVDVPGGGEDDD
jgi:uncharacterized cupin superfamily protein